MTSTDRAWTEGFVACEDGRVIGFAATGFSRWNRRQALWHLYVDRVLTEAAGPPAPCSTT
ncbi:hypothetical protein FHS23_000219 [Prauserella isguenensis]|uniref:GNAT family N-acetyltransferase n=1 Tax=Prauserella isguenensis TaxID=1470180 RepID=A0A839RVX4_9PSEU|nr:GNAT family N-acetyltransferase [Prauserella isguenensis]MBB3049224.1 hypothetical protein [Prauserella isguenensis]